MYWGAQHKIKSICSSWIPTVPSLSVLPWKSRPEIESMVQWSCTMPRRVKRSLSDQPGNLACVPSFNPLLCCCYPGSSWSLRLESAWPLSVQLLRTHGYVEKTEVQTKPVQVTGRERKRKRELLCFPGVITKRFFKITDFLSFHWLMISSPP